MNPNKHKKIDFFYIIGVLILGIIVYVYLAFNISFPVLNPSYNKNEHTLVNNNSNFEWPAQGGSAIGFNNLGVYQSHGSNKLEAMASTAKLITALLVLNKYPLLLNQKGPMITISPSDVSIYNNYLSAQGSVAAVVNGEKLSEYQMLQAMLLPSADNIADSLAIWAYGSINSYLLRANSYLVQKGLSDTHLAVDASGYSPESVSTPHDLILIGQLAMQNPVIAQIVAQKSVSNFPVVGTLKNINYLLGTDNIVGIKTGNNNLDGGIFVSASKVNLNNSQTTIFTAIMGQSSLWNVLHYSLNLVKSIQNSFVINSGVSDLKKGSVLGTYHLNWNHQTISAILSQSANLASLNGTKVSAKISLNTISLNTKKNTVVGKLILKNAIFKQSQTINLILNKSPKKPPLWWLLLHPKIVL